MEHDRGRGYLRVEDRSYPRVSRNLLTMVYSASSFLDDIIRMWKVKRTSKTDRPRLEIIAPIGAFEHQRQIVFDPTQDDVEKGRGVESLVKWRFVRHTKNESRFETYNNPAIAIGSSLSKSYSTSIPSSAPSPTSLSALSLSAFTPFTDSPPVERDA